MHVEQRILHQRNTPQGNFTILPTEVANLPPPPSAGPADKESIQKEKT